ncbi:hypothetical protein M501DRAFT_245698 [Patellaria atrata CBS 101060]|uniref:Fanconi-associated nuclease n=1 Tax=Patellaria atrata CBS 101060 TaxID=1346257 RepID=A0A9P4S5Z0_9PEZI|nr:hypothetical protein M501DRAFT_245698 [Patellaria atrata CBS 101060]
MLQTQSPAKHNQILGQSIKHPKSPDFGDINDFTVPPAKRLKRNDTIDDDEPVPSSPRPHPRQIPGSDAETEIEDTSRVENAQKTDIETALPPVTIDQEAIDDYEVNVWTDRTTERLIMSHEERMIRRSERKRGSIYVDAFNLALNTVLEEESHLFDKAEMKVFEIWRGLDYETQYLYVRLFLRKTSAWHRINSLGYENDIGYMGQAIAVLQTTRKLPVSLTDADDNPGELEAPKGTSLEATFRFADKSEEEITSLEEASSLLKLDELKVLAKEAKVQGRNKAELLKALQNHSRRQSGLGWVCLRRSDTESSTRSTGTAREDFEESIKDQNPTQENRDDYFIRKIMHDITGRCIRLSLAPLKLFERVHLVFYRSTEWTEKSLTTIILAQIARRNFPEFIVSRSANIFPSRSLLLEFEAAVRTQFRVDNILEFNGPPSPAQLQEILDICDEVYPRWRALLKEEQQKEDDVYESGEGAYLRRLSPAWVYTRVLHKGTSIHAKLKNYKKEHKLLDELLAQGLFHASRRGAWYQRKALLEEHYMPALTPAENRSDDMQGKYWRKIALQTCEVGLEDNLVHIIYHYDLQKRVTKLEKSLKIPKRAQHDFGHVRLTKPSEVTIEGTRVEMDTSSKSGLGRRNSSPHPNRRGAKTIWLDPLEDEAECSVEAMCLSHYRSQGWKGYHCEGSIVRTLFGYLFYDVLFTYIPNVFQTPYQTCPLDLHTDAFYPSRLSEINHRLAEIANGEAETIIKRVWDEHAERKTCIVGLDWTYALEDLLEIVRLFDGQALGTICKVIAQDYGQRGGGVPDLFLWHMERREIMFAEVKSENDRLSDTQRLWIHVLTGAGIRVELCNAVAKKVIHR